MPFLLFLFIIIAAHHACDSPPDYLVAPPAAKPATLEELEELYELFDALPEWVIATREECIELNGQWTPDGCYIGGLGRSVEEEVVEVEVVEVEVVEEEVVEGGRGEVVEVVEGRRGRRGRGRRGRRGRGRRGSQG